MSLRQYLSSVVLTCFQNDDVLQSLFLFEGITRKDWCESIVIDGRWTSTFDVIVFSYVMKINVITVGNYMNGFSVQSSKTYFNTINPHLDRTSQQWIPDEPTIHLFFHMHLSNSFNTSTASANSTSQNPLKVLLIHLSNPISFQLIQSFEQPSTMSPSNPDS